MGGDHRVERRNCRSSALRDELVHRPFEQRVVLASPEGGDLDVRDAIPDVPVDRQGRVGLLVKEEGPDGPDSRLGARSAFRPTA
jgi:hypothetical protein